MTKQITKAQADAISNAIPGDMVVAHGRVLNALRARGAIDDNGCLTPYGSHLFSKYVGRRRSHGLTARTSARLAASWLLRNEKRFASNASLLAVAEKVDDSNEKARGLSFENLLGAVRAAAREVGREIVTVDGEERIA